MEFVEGIKKVKQMCETYNSCDECPASKARELNCCPFSHIHMKYVNEKFAKIVEDWKPPIDWSKVAVDTPIIVWNSNGCTKHRRYFAKYEAGKIYTWDGGCTSWTALTTTEWKYGELAEVENK